MYKKELEALKRSNRFREREIYSSFIDLASNDYLGLSEKKSIFKKACKRVLKYSSHSSKASLLVNGYHPIHKKFEKYIAALNEFERGLVVGSGFLANIALIESLARRGDVLILDEKFHASGVLASKLSLGKVLFFKHNDSFHLNEILKKESFKRAIVATEGVYSMDGDILNPEIFNVCRREDTLLIVDEAHSGGVLGEKFLGVFEYFKIKPQKNHIKMGTLGKALGSYGAYILCSKEIEDFLLNRAKSIIYSTAVSPFDIALAHEGMKYIQKNRDKLGKKRERNRKLFEKYLGLRMEALIASIEIGDLKKVMDLKRKFLKKGFIIGAIRPPTVDRALIRIIPRLNIKKDILKEFLKALKREI